MVGNRKRLLTIGTSRDIADSKPMRTFDLKSNSDFSNIMERGKGD